MVKPQPNIFKQAHLPVKKKSILIIDDDVDILEAHKTLLEMDNYEVFTARSGGEAFTVLSKIAAPDLILLDNCMEGMSGPDFLLKLDKQSPEIIKTVPIVLCTATNIIPESKAVGYIRKPIDNDKLLEAISRFIEVGTTHSTYLH